MHPTVPTEEDGEAMTDQGPISNPYSDIAVELRRVADDLDFGLGGFSLNPPRMFEVDIQPCPGRTDEETIAIVDTVAGALLGCVAETRELAAGSYQHRVRHARGPITVSIYQRVEPPDPRDAEIAHLRAENDVLRAAASASYGREPDNADSGMRVPGYVGGYSAQDRAAELTETHPADPAS